MGPSHSLLDIVLTYLAASRAARSLQVLHKMFDFHRVTCGTDTMFQRHRDGVHTCLLRRQVRMLLLDLGDCVESRQQPRMEASPEYTAAAQSLKTHIDSLSSEILEQVHSNAKAAHAMRRARQEAQDRIRRQQEEAERRRQEWLAAEESRSLQERQRQAEAERGAQRYNQYYGGCKVIQYVPSPSCYVSYGSSGCSYNDNDESYHGRSSSRRHYDAAEYSGGSSGSSGRHIGITQKGEQCKICLKGYNCPYH